MSAQPSASPSSPDKAVATGAPLMPMGPPVASNKVLTKENYREINRASRLSGLKPAIQERLRTELKEYAFSQCKETISALGECSKREGMLVAINCRDCNNAMNKCLDLYFTDDLFDDYVRTKGYEPLPRYTSLPTRVVDAFNGLFK